MKVDVFLSHRSEHAEVAGLLTTLLTDALGPNLTVFVSSDMGSLRGGDGWFEKIVSSAREATVVLVLLSPESSGTPWLNFEAGLGQGAGHRVIPILFRGLTAEALGAPLNHLQVRIVEREPDVCAMLEDVAIALGRQRNLDQEMGVAMKFVKNLVDMQGRLPYALVKVWPYLVSKEGRTEIHFQLVNDGTRDVEPLEAWASIPRQALLENWTPPVAPPAFTFSTESQDGESVVTLRLRSDQPGPTFGNSRYRFDFDPLPRVITPHMSPHELSELRLLIRPFAERDGGTMVRFGLNARSNVHHSDKSTLWDIALRERPQRKNA